MNKEGRKTDNWGMRSTEKDARQAAIQVLMVEVFLTLR